jgi:cysteine desulfurase
VSTRAYLDHASSAPLRPGVLDAMLPWLTEHFADPGRVHTEARMTRAALEAARHDVATFVDARPREIVFTSGGTEAIAHAHHWVRGHVVTTAVEHSAVRESIAAATDDVTVVGVDRLGRVDRDEIVAAIRPDTALVSIQAVNHEVGTAQPLDIPRPDGVLLHVDACSAIGRHPLSFRSIGADLMSVTAHKLGGPKGAGALVVRRGLRIPSLLVGGAQERARRAGIENTPAMVGFAAAVRGIDLAAESARARALVERAAAGALAVSGVERFGAGDLADVLCLGVAGVEAEPILLGLDQHGVAVHSGSACASEMLEPSPVLAAMGVDAHHSLRVSVGWTTTEADVDRFVDAFATVVQRLRSLRA